MDDPYRKLVATHKIRMTVHVPHMYSCALLGMVTDTTATLKGEDKALHTEKAVWMSKHARDGLRTRHKKFTDNQEKPQCVLEQRTNMFMSLEERRTQNVTRRNEAQFLRAGGTPCGCESVTD